MRMIICVCVCDSPLTQVLITVVSTVAKDNVTETLNDNDSSSEVTLIFKNCAAQIFLLKGRNKKPSEKG